MVNIVHRIGIKASVEKVHDALSTLEGLGGWWTQDVSEKLQSEKKFNLILKQLLENF